MRAPAIRFCGGLLATIVLNCSIASGIADEPAAAPPNAAELVQWVIDAENKIHGFSSMRLQVEVRMRMAPRVLAEAKANRDKGLPGIDPVAEVTGTHDLVFDASRIRTSERFSDGRSTVMAWDGKICKTYHRADGRETAEISPEIGGRFNSHALAWLQIGTHRFWWSKEAIAPRVGSVPPAEFELGGTETLRGETCYRLDWPRKLHRLYVSTADRRLRGLIVFEALSLEEDVALRSRISGEEFATLDEANAWRGGLSEEARQEFNREFYRRRFELGSRPAQFDVGDESPDKPATAAAAQSSRIACKGCVKIKRASEQTFFGDYRELAPGFWLPYRWGMNLMGCDKGETYAAMVVEATVVNAEVDPRLADSDFDAEIPEGVATVDHRYDPPPRYGYKKKFTVNEWQAILDEQQREIAAQQRSAAARHARVGQGAMEFPATGACFNSPALAWKDLRGKVVILEFFSQSCGACQGDVAELRQLHKHRDQTGVAVVGVHTDPIDREAAKKHLSEREIDYPVYVDVDAAANEEPGPLCRWYEIDGLPATALVDAEGKVVAIGTLEEIVDQAVALTQKANEGK